VGLVTRPQLRLVWETFDDVTLAKALRQLADASGYNLVVDVRVADKAKTKVSARLANVPVDTAVRVLADMADLGVVRLDNLFYVTNRENAAQIRAEEERRWRASAPALGGVALPKK
jgi:type II secretory pathway component HofQ